ANALLHVQDEDNVISLFIGGPDKAQNWHSQRFIQKIQTLERHAQASCIKLVATTSRRTPKVVIEALGQSRELGLYQHLILVNESNPSGGFEAMLTVARTHFVTMDSISMISEVIGTGKPVVVVTDGSMAGLRPKIRRFLNSIKKLGVVVWEEESAEDILKKIGKTMSIDIKKDNQIIIRTALEQCV
ncbi:MAG: mitochondrial fission protein ELM1, partial [Candidatus Omnitrophota bacterium]